MISTCHGVQKRLTAKIVPLAAAILLLPMTALYSYGAEPFPAKADDAGVWAEIAYVRFQAAQGYDLQSDNRKQAAFGVRGPRDPAIPGDELDLAGDEKYLACEEYQRAAKHWEKAAQLYQSSVGSDKASGAKENAAAAWQAAKRTLLESTELYRMAEEYYEAANDLPKRTTVLGKIARNLERLMEINLDVPWSSVSRSKPVVADHENRRRAGLDFGPQHGSAGPHYKIGTSARGLGGFHGIFNPVMSSSAKNATPGAVIASLKEELLGDHRRFGIELSAQ